MNDLTIQFKYAKKYFLCLFVLLILTEDMFSIERKCVCVGEGIGREGGRRRERGWEGGGEETLM